MKVMQLPLLKIISLLVLMLFGSEVKAWEWSSDAVSGIYVPHTFPTINGVKYEFGMYSVPDFRENDYVQIYGTGSENYGNVSIPTSMTWDVYGYGDFSVTPNYIRDHAFYNLKTLKTPSMPSMFFLDRF